MPSGGRLHHGHGADHADVAVEIPLVDRRHLEFDEAVGLRRGDAAFAPLDHGMETLVDGVAKPLGERDGPVFRGEDQADRPRGERDTAARHPGAELRLRVERAHRDGIDEQRAFRHAEHVAVAHAVAQHRHLGEPCLHQPAVGDARGVVVRRHFHVDVETIPLLHTGGQVGMHPDERRRRRGKQLVGLDDAARLHVGHQRLALQARRRIAAGAREPGDERRPLDPLRRRAPGRGVIADVLGVGLEVDERLDLGALAADRRSRAAGRQAGESHEEQEHGGVSCGSHRGRLRSEGNAAKMRRESRCRAAEGQGCFASESPGQTAGESSWRRPERLLRSRPRTENRAPLE